MKQTHKNYFHPAAIAVSLLFLLGFLWVFWFLQKVAVSANTKTPSPAAQPSQIDGTASSPESPYKAQQNEKSTPAKSTIVTLDNAQEKTTFLLANNLRPSDLSLIADTKSYVVAKSREDLDFPKGVTSQQNIRYSALQTPNDTLHPQWFTSLTSQEAAWDLTTGSSSNTIAVIDTGFGLTHQDLTNRWHINTGEYGSGKDTNGVDDDSNGYIDDWRGWSFVLDSNNPTAGQTNPSGLSVAHGTAVAGFAAETGNNSVGAAGVDWNAKILPLQALSDNGNGFTSSVIAAINYARQQGATVINLSLGSTQSDPLLSQAIDQAVNAGIVVVAAAGNDGCNCISYPANYSNVVAVGASNDQDQRASFSSYGSNLDVVAPGTGSLKTTLWSQANQTSLYSSTASGTSFASPIVAGVVSLFRALNSTATPSEVTESLRYGADKIGGMGGNSFTSQYGYGRLNMRATVRLASLTHPDGTLVIDKNTGAVYLLEGGEKRYISSPQIFLSYYQDILKQAKQATASDLALPDGANLNFYSGTLVKGSGNAIYALSYSGSTLQKRHISTGEDFAQLGYKANEWINVSDSFLSGVADGVALTGSDAHPNGTLVRQNGQHEVYILENGQRRHIPTVEILQAFHKGKFIVRNATAADMALSTGSTATLEEGALVKAPNNAIYIIDNDSGTLEKRYITSPFIHNLLGFTEQDRFDVPNSALPSPNGSDVN